MPVRRNPAVIQYFHAQVVVVGFIRIEQRGLEDALRRAILHEVVIDKLSPQALGKRGLKILTQYLELFADLPKEIRRGIYAAKTGNLKIRVELSQLDELQHLVMRASLLRAAAGITAALLIGGSILMAFLK